ncbi:hypothetical protein Tco_0708258 [Tanacetum coccineum]
MLGKEPNKVYDPFLKAWLGYKIHEHLKKAIAVQPKMYHGEMLHSTNLKIDSPDSEETLEDAEEKPSVEQTYFSIPSTSNHSSEPKETTSDLPIQQMSKENRQRKWMLESQNSLREFYKTDVIPMSDSLSIKLKELQQELIDEVQEMLNIFELKEQKVTGKSPKENIIQNEIDRLFEVSLTSEIQDCVLISVEKQKNEMLRNELEKSSSGSKDIQANLL